MIKMISLIFLFSLLVFVKSKDQLHEIHISRSLERSRWKLNVSEVWVINLDRRPERMRLMSAQLKELQIPFQRFSAVDFGDGKNESQLKVAMQELQKETKINLEQVKVDLNNTDRSDFTWGSIGCWQSHLQLYLRLTASPSSGPFLVLEDDLELFPHIIKVLSRKFLSHYLPDDWEMLYLTHDGLKCFLEGAQLANDRAVDFQFCQVQYAWQTAAYLIRSPAAAKKLTSFGNTPHAQVADWYLNERFHKKEIIAYALLYFAARQRRERFCSDINPSLQCVKLKSK